MKSSPVALASALLVTFACASPPAETPPEPKVDLAAEKAALMKADGEMNAAAGDLDKYMSFYASNAHYMGPSSGLLVGKDAIRARMETVTSLPGFSQDSSADVVKVAEAGDLAVILGSTSVGLTVDEGNTMLLGGKYITIWTKETGTWKVLGEFMNTIPGSEEIKPTEE